MKFIGKVAVITGASSGIGEGVAKRFLEEGAKVVGCGIEATAQIQHENMVYIQADLTQFDAAVQVIEAGRKAFGQIDILVNCAGVTLTGNLEETTTENFTKQFDINVVGVFNMCKAAIGELKQQKGAAIVNIGSRLGVRPIPGRVSYCPSKAAVAMLTKCIAMEYAPFVRANCIHPGLTETPMIKDRIEGSGDPDKVRAEMANMYLLKRMGTIEDIANAAVYLANEESSFVTGEGIGVCGGDLI
ncbi:MAG: SDR family oxidoreductase [Cellulosilyticaceae bacterium]|uniref:SDR family NAD(P)-dependent oxidoreductase n=1 Tax=Niameybacter sp. TaxID=2033640 RepID=UPI002FC7FFFC